MSAGKDRRLPNKNSSALLTSEGWHHLLSNRLAEARAAFLEEGGPEGLASLGCLALPTGNFQALSAPWFELIQRYPQHWSAAAVIPMLVDAGGGLDAQEDLNERLRRQMGHCPAQFSSLTQDLLGPSQRLRWKGCAQDDRLRWHTLQTCADASCCDLEQLNNFHQRRFYAATSLLIEQETHTHLDCDLGSGEVRVWLNGRMVLRALRNYTHHWAGMPFRVAVRLKAGENQLLVRRDLSESGGVNFRIRLGVRVSRSRPAELPPTEHEIPWSEPWLLQTIPEEWRLLRANYISSGSDSSKRPTNTLPPGTRPTRIPHC